MHIAHIIEADKMSAQEDAPSTVVGLTTVDGLSIVLGMEENSWDAIERVALELGIGAEAIRKWRIRGVPRSWRLDLLRADTRREIDEKDFARPPGPRRQAAAACLSNGGADNIPA
jgi:hypothetical protein